MAAKITLFILDDNIYKSQEFVEKSIYNSKIDSKLLLQLTESFEWKGQHNLQELTANILKSKHSQSGNIITYGFNHPSICLDEIDNGLKPDIIIFDWEYGSESYKESSNWLTEILNTTDAFIFVYSHVRDAIPTYLNKKEFDEYSPRFQLFLKGDLESSIFSTEEFIFQYIVSRVSKTNLIKIQGIDITFNENGYLSNPSDILHLEKIMGRATLISIMKEKGFSINQENIENIMSKITSKLLFDSKRNFLITPDSILLIQKFKPEKELSYLEALKKFGLIKVKEVLEVGFIKV